MIRGTTEQFKFKLPCAKINLRWIKIKFSQEHNYHELLPIIKGLDNCRQANDNQQVVYVTLTSEETSRFSDKYKAQLQVRGQRSDGRVFGCKPQYIVVYPMDDKLIDGVNPEVPEIPETEDPGEIIVLDGNQIIDLEVI